MKSSDIDVLLAIPYIQELLNEAGHSMECFRQNVEEFIPKPTPNAQWIEENGEDPFKGGYDCERHELPMGELSDYALANAMFMNYDQIPSMAEMLARTKKMPIVWMTAGKERMRWLSFQNHLLKQEVSRLKGE